VNRSVDVRGLWYAAVAYGLWGAVPIYWKLLQGFPAIQLICHRIIWSCVMLAAMLAISRQWAALWKALRAPRAMAIYTTAAVVVGVNWLIYVWAVNSGRIVQTSLGYFINPLVNVLLGVLVFGERLRRWQWVAVGLAAAGVLFLTILYGGVPWIALAVAVTFGTYGMLKKIAPLGPVEGLALETGILLLPAAAYLLAVERSGSGGFLQQSAVLQVVMICAGPVTTIPLLLFSAAAQRIPMSSIGMLQYISPTLQLLVGVLLYKEPFGGLQFIGFGLVWAALVAFAVEGYATRTQLTAPA
jgi:chloramphenicol-sensitive protein RarD